jgi:predicted RNA-binding protein
MCEANAYLIQDNNERLIMESVDVVEPSEGNTWRLINIFGDQKDIKARIKAMKLVDHKIVFEAIDD